MLIISGSEIGLAADLEDLLKTIKAVERQGKGNIEAQQAVQELSKNDGAVLVPLLKAFDGANPLAVNWLRGAFEVIADREIQKNAGLPASQLEAFIKDTAQDPRARRVAYEWLSKVDTGLSDRLVPGMLNDPSPEFRRDAVSRLIEKAKSLDAEKQRDEIVQIYREALRGATDKDQVAAIVEPLKKLGQDVDLKAHFGFLTQWFVLGPFDNHEGMGFNSSYPPEEGVDLTAKYKGQLGEVEWKPLGTNDDYGMIDIAKSVGPHKGAAIYMTTEFSTPVHKKVQIRLGTPNAWKLWVNGKLAFAREEYHRGSGLDQYKVQTELKPGRNVLLLKICQNEQKEDWAQDYKVQLRVCDPSGVSVLSSDTNKDRTSANVPAKTSVER
ncbi:MAG: hypothetical protein AB7O26_06665 [Planctomycetaceae bacterium]